MSIEITSLDHVNVTVPKSLEAAAKHFYGTLLGIEEIPKPVETRKNGGAWYRIGPVQLHLSLDEAAVGDRQSSKRHVCYMVKDVAAAEQSLREAGVEIFPDPQPIAGWPRFYVRDPGGNRIEIAQRTG
jgi:catechol 2,3-dioxygenase-like lactoylglutathione lyase family enzyme